MKKGSEIIFEALNDVSDELLLRADPINYANSRRKKMTRLAMASCIALVLVSAALLTVIFTGPAETEPFLDNAAPMHFYYEGDLYTMHHISTVTKVLPEGYDYLENVVNVGNKFSGTDFEGNLDGKIYLNSEDETQAYVAIPGELYEDGITRYVYFTVRDQSE